MSSSDKSRRAVSYLVRLWVEDRETDIVRGVLSSTPGQGVEMGVDGAEVVRGFVRNLKTGEESHLSNPDRLVRELLRDLTPADTPDEIGDRDRAEDFAPG